MWIYSQSPHSRYNNKIVSWTHLFHLFFCLHCFLVWLECYEVVKVGKMIKTILKRKIKREERARFNLIKIKAQVFSHTHQNSGYWGCSKLIQTKDTKHYWLQKFSSSDNEKVSFLNFFGSLFFLHLKFSHHHYLSSNPIWLPWQFTFPCEMFSWTRFTFLKHFILAVQFPRLQ